MPSDRHVVGRSEDPAIVAPSPTGELHVKGGSSRKVFPHTKIKKEEDPEVELRRKRGLAAQRVSSRVLFPEGNPYRRD